MDEARALVNFAATRAAADQTVSDRSPLMAARALLDALAAQLSDPSDRESFANSSVVARVDELLRQAK
jgi:hypothetical protein